jgi:hypothetical protein
MTSPVDITNRALQAIGTRSTVSAMNEGSNEANNASLCYVATRQELIRAAPWNFCTATATLALLKSVPGTPENPTALNGVWSAAWPPPGWAYEYAYPGDCLRARKVVTNSMTPQGGGVPLFPIANASVQPVWKLPGTRFQVTTDSDVNGNPFTCILANVDQAILCYLRDIVIEDVWDPLFTDAMVAALAGKLALSLTGDKQLAQLRFKMANDKILEARGADANEGVTIIDHTPDWITRGHGIGFLPAGGTLTGFTLSYGGLF